MGRETSVKTSALVGLLLIFVPFVTAQAQAFEGLSRAGVESAVDYADRETYHTVYLSYAGSLFEWDGTKSRFLGHLEGDYHWISRPSGSPYFAVSGWKTTVLIDTRPGGKVSRLLPPNSDLVGKPQTVVGAEVNSKGTLAIVRLGWSNSDESWSKPYLATVPGMAVVKALEDYGNYWFTADGTKLVWSRPDWDPVTGEERGTKMTYLSSGGEELTGAVKARDREPNQSQSLDPQGLSGSEDRRKTALPDFVWNEFGLRALSAKWTSGNLSYDVAEWLSGLPGGPQPSYDWQTSRRPVQTLSLLGLELDSDRGLTTLKRQSPDGKPLWSKTFLGYGVVGSWNASPETNRAWLLLNKSKVSADGTYAEAAQVLRPLNWTTGLPIGPDRPIPFPGIRQITDSEPSEGWMSLSTYSFPTLFWPDLDRWATPDGTWIVTKGVPDRLESGPDRGVTRKAGKSLTVLASAPGQIGSIVRLTRSPDASWFLAVDEAGQVFARRSTDGEVLAVAPLEKVGPEFLSGISSTAPTKPPRAAPPPRPWYSITDVTMTIASTFPKPVGKK